MSSHPLQPGRYPVVDQPANSRAPHFFNNARNINIYGSTFIGVGGNLNNFHGDVTEYGLASLKQLSSSSASHDSRQRYPPPRCHPGTRGGVLKVMMDFVDNRHSHSMLWLCGSTGVGKSAIVQTLAEQCESSGTLAATFFFSRGDPHRGTSHHLFSTLAYQLASSIPEVRGYIDLAARKHPNINTISAEAQFRGLIVGPFRNAGVSWTVSTPRLVLIDGIDECQEPSETQHALLTLIADALAGHAIPLRFIIASRPEPHIRNVFERFKNISRRVVLDESFAPDHDIEVYLRDGFHEIRRERGLLMSSVSEHWPSNEVIGVLVKKASAQFLYASTILKFINDENFRPVEQLDAVLKMTSDASSVSSVFDQLYREILQASIDRDGDLLSVVRVLGFIKVLHCPQVHTVLEDILGLKIGEIPRILRRLHSLLDLPDQSESNNSTRPIRIRHASFHEFLSDNERSGIFFIDESAFQTDLCIQSFNMLINWLSKDWRSRYFNHHPPTPKTLSYLKRHLLGHYLLALPASRQVILEHLRKRMYAELFTNDPDRVTFNVIHTMMTVLVNMLFDAADYPMFPRCDSYEFSDDDVLTTEDLELLVERLTLDDDILGIYTGCCSLLHQYYRDTLAASSDLNNLINLIPGWPIVYEHLSLCRIAEYFDVDINIIADLIARCDKFTSIYENADGTLRFMLNRHVSEFLFDQYYSQQYFIDPLFHRSQLARQCVRLLSGCHQSNRSIPNYKIEGLKAIPCTFLYPHQSSITRSNVDANRLWDFLRPLQLIQDNDICILWPLHTHKLNYYWVGVQFVLSWIWEQLKVSQDGPYHMEYYSLIDQLYHEILCAEDLDHGKLIKLRSPFAEHIKWSMRSEDSRTADVVQQFGGNATHHGIRLSEELLLINIHPLVGFLTDSRRAGLLFIEAAAFHTQMAEHQLVRLSPGMSASHDPVEKWLKESLRNECGLAFHLSRSLPNPTLLQLLQSGISSLSNNVSYSGMLKVVNWLESIDTPILPLGLYLGCRAVLESHCGKGSDQDDDDSGISSDMELVIRRVIFSSKKYLNGGVSTIVMEPWGFKLACMDDNSNVDPTSYSRMV